MNNSAQFISAASTSWLVRQDARRGGVFENFFQLDSESGEFVRRHQLLQALEKLAFFFADVGGELLRKSRQAFRGHATCFSLREKFAERGVIGH